jgi:hypothetical protein
MRRRLRRRSRRRRAAVGVGAVSRVAPSGGFGPAAPFGDRLGAEGGPAPQRLRSLPDDCGSAGGCGHLGCGVIGAEPCPPAVEGEGAPSGEVEAASL